MYLSLDGTDCSIEEQTPFSREWYSHKLNGPGLRYEIGLNIASGDIVWAYGGYPWGSYPDLKLARECYVHAVGLGEKTIADNGYKDPKYFIYPAAYPNTAQSQSRIRARHETVNKRLKQWNVLVHAFRHDISKHIRCFHAVVNVTQIMIQSGEKLFDI